MNRDQLHQLLEQVRAGNLDIASAAAQLETPPLADIGFATVDLHRRDRCGYPEVILAEGKTSEWAEGVVRRLREAGQDVLATRVSAEQAAHLGQCFPEARQDRLARTFWWPMKAERPEGVGMVQLVTAGTGDIPVAREALVTVEAMGAKASLIVDVGVAGIHRILSHREALTRADVVIVVAGMDGALPSVVGGLVDCPVIAVPTSIGYGAAFGGVAALLTMLNSCSAGVVTVNIDAGFKAGYVAALIAHRIAKARSLGDLR